MKERALRYKNLTKTTIRRMMAITEISRELVLESGVSGQIVDPELKKNVASTFFRL